MSNNNDIKNLLIVNEKDYSKKIAEDNARRIIKFAKISDKGGIIYLDNKLSPDDKLRIALTIRFIAHTLDENITETITLKELSTALSERLEAVGSRLSKIIKNENFAKKISKGVYIVQRVAINKFISSLKNNENVIVSKKRKANKNGIKRKDKAVTGIGKNILELLINQDFFKTPKTIKEVSEKLREETKIYDERIIDTTIRKTFVDSKKILRRIDVKKNPIQNKNIGKARRVYINR